MYSLLIIEKKNQLSLNEAKSLPNILDYLQLNVFFWKITRLNLNNLSFGFKSLRNKFEYKKLKGFVYLYLQV